MIRTSCTADSFISSEVCKGEFCNKTPLTADSNWWGCRPSLVTQHGPQTLASGTDGNSHKPGKSDNRSIRITVSNGQAYRLRPVRHGEFLEDPCQSCPDGHFLQLEFFRDLAIAHSL